VALVSGPKKRTSGVDSDARRVHFQFSGLSELSTSKPRDFQSLASWLSSSVDAEPPLVPMLERGSVVEGNQIKSAQEGAAPSSKARTF
jgi:hypothetical protein